MTALALAVVPSSFADTTWQGTNATWSVVGNWSAGAPTSGQLAIHPGNATFQTLDLAGGTGRVTTGIRFDFFSGGSGYIFNGTAGSVAGFFIRSGGTANGIVNNDDNTQTFNVPIKLTSNTGIAGAGAAMTFNAAAGDLVFNGNNTSTGFPWSINLNGASALTIDGSHNTTIGSSGAGQIVNTNLATSTGIIKSGSGTLTLAGTAANTYTGTNYVNAGTVVLAKVNAFGAGNALVLNGGTIQCPSFAQAFGTLTLANSSTIDFGAGATSVTFADSSSIDWGTFNLTLLNWTAGQDTLRFGTTGNALTIAQLAHIFYGDLGNAGAQIDLNGFVTVVAAPEPSTVGLGLLGGLAFVGEWVRRRNRSQPSQGA